MIKILKKEIDGSKSIFYNKETSDHRRRRAGEVKLPSEQELSRRFAEGMRRLRRGPCGAAWWAARDDVESCETGTPA
jgi:hypothetical protein